MNYQALPSDTGFRFRLVEEALRTRYGKNPFRLLDVGGYPGEFVRVMKSQLPMAEGLTLDQPEEALPDYVSGSGARLPFEDASFDAVVSMDTLEHIPPEERAAFLGELSRVARRHVIITAPFAHNAVAACEKGLDGLHRSLFNERHPWLWEHVENGLPELVATIEQFRENRPFGLVDLVGSYDLNQWVVWQAMSLARRAMGRLDEAWEDWDRQLRETATPAPSSLPYRWMLVFERNAGGIAYEDRLPDADAGGEAVALSNLLALLIESTAAQTTSAPREHRPVIEQRLKDALVAAEDHAVSLQNRVKASEKRGRTLRRIFGK